MLAISLALAATAAAAPKANARAAATTIGADCVGCHAASVTEAEAGGHSGLECVTCHEGAAAHVADAASPKNPMLYPKVHFDMEVCKGCHTDQYNSFMIAAGNRTVYGGSDGGAHAPKGWSKTQDLPYWNVLIDGHPFVLETYEDRPMSVNQIEHQETIRPGSESCMA
ncbi:MAG: hypothetical protein FJ030_08255 [Chloroflexi bacterium]|nr:hypothetical protein [Chloroflexota bacterium]